MVEPAMTGHVTPLPLRRVTINLTTNLGSGGWAEGDQYVDIEYLFGSEYGDTLTGNAGNNYFLCLFWR